MSLMSASISSFLQEIEGSFDESLSRIMKIPLARKWLYCTSLSEKQCLPFPVNVNVSLSVHGHISRPYKGHSVRKNYQLISNVKLENAGLRHNGN